MTRLHAWASSSITALVLVAGCARMQPGLGFQDVQSDVARRLQSDQASRIHWNTGSGEDAEATAAVQSLLAGEITAPQAVQIGLLNNRDLQAVYEELNIAQADVVQAGLLRNPIFSGELRFSTGGGGTGIVLDVAQEFVGLLSMPMRKSLAAAAFESAKLRVTSEVLDTAYALQTAFYDYQAALQRREMRETVAGASAASFDLARRLHDAGNIRDVDLTGEEALHQQAALDLAAADARVVATRERLNALMGLWGDDAQRWKSAPRLAALPEQEAPIDGLERAAIESSLELALLRRDAEMAARTAGLTERLAWLEPGEIGAAAEREIEGGWSVGPSLALPIPLFDQGQASATSARASYNQAAHRTYARAVEIRSRVRAAHHELLAAHKRALTYQSVLLPLRARIVDQTQLLYNAMQVSAFQLLDARMNQISAGEQYIDALHEYWLARASLDQILRGRMTPIELASTQDPAERSTHRGRATHGQGGHQ